MVQTLFDSVVFVSICMCSNECIYFSDSVCTVLQCNSESCKHKDVSAGSSLQDFKKKKKKLLKKKRKKKKNLRDSQHSHKP